MKKLIFSVALLILSAPSVWAAGTLVQSVPTETNLAQPGVPLTQAVWIQMFREAHTSIDMGEFYFDSAQGGPLEPVISELRKAGQRGVRIRVLVSPLFAKQYQPTFARIKNIPNLKMRFLDLSHPSHGILHAKYFVVDGRTVFLGSQNFDWCALNQIHEVGVKLTDKRIAHQLSSIFEADWKFSETQQVPRRATPPMKLPKPATELVASPAFLNPPGIRPAIEALIELLNQARSSIHIAVMSYSTTDRYGTPKGAQWKTIDSALRRAAKRGVQIELLVSDWGTGKPAIDELKSLEKEAGAQIRIISIPEAKSGHIPYARVMHSKFMTIDDRILWVGTSNWEKNYFSSSRNVELIFRKSPVLESQAHGIFARLWNSRYTEKLDLAKTYEPRKRD